MLLEVFLRGFFCEMAAGFFLVFSVAWFDSGYMCLSVYGGVGLAGCDAPCAVFFRGFQALMRCIMAGMDQLEHFMAPCRKLRKFRSYSSSWSSSSLSLRRGRFPWSSLFGGPWRFRSCSSCWVVDVPGMHVVQVFPVPQLQFIEVSLYPCRGAEFISWSRQRVRPGISQLLHRVIDVPVHRSCKSSFASWAVWKWPRLSSTSAVARSCCLAGSARWYAATALWARIALSLFVVCFF